MRALIAALFLGAACTAHAAEEGPLRAGVVPDSPPLVQKDWAGKPTGFSVALIQAIGLRLKRKVLFTEAPMPELEKQLAGGSIDVLPGPVPATPERAAYLLFTEGYFWTEYQFGLHRGGALASLGDLHGKRLAVQKDTEYAEGAARNAAARGFTFAPQPTLAAVFDALRQGHADASLTSSPSLRAAVAASHGDIAAGLALKETRTHDSLAVAESEIELRDEIEEALRCLKQDGVVAKLAKTWLGNTPGPEDLENLVIPGYGVPGLAGYDPKPHKPRCSK